MTDLTASRPTACRATASPAAADHARPVRLDRGSLRLVGDLPAAARRAFGLALALERGRLDVRVPDGRAFRVEGRLPGPEARIDIHDWRFARRVLAAGDVGVGESYIAGEWSSPAVATVLELFAVNRHATFERLAARPLVRALLRVRHWLNRNTRTGSRRNISAHYDLGNAFYAAWLDETMTYSAGLFATGANDLASAQREKYRALARAARIEPDHHVLEIGCGWGGFAAFAAAEIGARVTALTISREQHDYARRRIQEAGLGDRVDVQLRDYRDERGTYDRIASIEMLEAVGERYWPVYFRSLVERLKPGGAAGLQTIVIRDDLFDSYRRTPDFIQRHVFPGGMLPSPARLAALGRSVGLDLVAERAFGADYARTLAEWRARFRRAWPEIVPLGFDERFRRLWEFYLSYCEAGFRSGNVDVRQVVFTRPG